MRLLHTANIKLVDFTGSAIPPYAILSHTWGDHELTYADMLSEKAGEMPGYAKIANACFIAAKCSLSYIWIDTCCIDKTSSAELSESINSMYQWYRESVVCIAYMGDVPSRSQRTGFSSAVDTAEFAKSRWFTRGWTLQELIAPAILIFFDEKWGIIGTKSTETRRLSDITGIPSPILLGGDLGKASVAQRMSWASKRKATRIEDMAYCLMGLFGIHMPLLYGEGDRAFGRLQEEIMKVSDDYSLFAWRSIPTGPSILSSDDGSGLLAPSPAEFLRSGNIVPLQTFHPLNSLNGPLTLSNKGIHLTVPLLKLDRQHLVVLNCTESGEAEGSTCYTILVKDVSLTQAYFERIHCDRLKLIDVKRPSIPTPSLANICFRRKILYHKPAFNSRVLREQENIIMGVLGGRPSTSNFNFQRQLEVLSISNDTTGNDTSDDEYIGDESRHVATPAGSSFSDDALPHEVTLLQRTAVLIKTALPSGRDTETLRDIRGMLSIIVPRDYVSLDLAGAPVLGSFNVVNHNTSRRDKAEGSQPAWKTARLVMKQVETQSFIIENIYIATARFRFERELGTRLPVSSVTDIRISPGIDDKMKHAQMTIRMAPSDAAVFMSEIKSIQNQHAWVAVPLPPPDVIK